MVAITDFYVILDYELPTCVGGKSVPKKHVLTAHARQKVLSVYIGMCIHKFL